MLSLQLPAPDPQAKPQFRDLPSCEFWLSQLHLTNVAEAQRLIAQELDALNRTELPAALRLGMLEMLRETVEFVQSGCARKYSGKPLPLSAAELASLNAVTALWHGMSVAYQHCLNAAIAGNRELDSRVALICERCLHYAGLQIVEHYRAGQQFDGDLWQRLHGLYAYAEQHSFAEQPIKAGKQQAAPSCRDVYVRALLEHLANPYELSRKQQEITASWLAQWSPLVSLRDQMPQGTDASWLVVDLASAGGVQHLQNVAPAITTRYLDMSELSKAIRVKTVLLEQGQAPADLGLGGCTPDECKDLIEHLHRHWCEGRTTRLFGRSSAAQKMQVCFGLAAAYYFATGKPFRQPRKGSESVDQRESKQIEALGHVSILDPKASTSQIGFALESWELQEESALGLRLMREPESGRRVSVGQLIALRPEGSEQFMLGDIRWLMADAAGKLHAGVRTLPGLPHPAAVRATGINPTVSIKYVQCFLLPYIPALQTPARIVLPAGWFKPKRILEISDQNVEQSIRLVELFEKGSDFEHVSYVAAYAKAGL